MVCHDQRRHRGLDAGERPWPQGDRLRLCAVLHDEHRLDLHARTQPDGGGLMWQNGILFAVNLLGVYQYLLSAKNRRKMKVVAKAVEKFEAQEEQREATA
jgi:hypothetical protein